VARALGWILNPSASMNPSASKGARGAPSHAGAQRPRPLLVLALVMLLVLALVMLLVLALVMLLVLALVMLLVLDAGDGGAPRLLTLKLTITESVSP